MHEQKFPCSVCGNERAAEMMKVPELRALRQVINRAPTIDDLAEHVICRECAPAAKGIVKLYPYDSTVAELERRRKEREQKKSFFSMRYAFKQAGIGK